MENKDKQNSKNWKYFIAGALGVIVYKIFFDFIWPLISQ